MDRVEALRQSSLMRALEERQLMALAGIASERRFEPGSYLLRQGDTRAMTMFVVLEGKVEVRRDGTPIAELGPGSHVGEMALLAPDDLARSADVVALEPTAVLQLTKWDVFPFLKSNPDTALAIIGELARRLVLADERLAGA